MTIEALIKAVPPPASPFQAFSGPWEPVEAEIGRELPQDYKEFARLYGSGHWFDFMGVYVPRTRNPWSRLERQVRMVCDTFFDRDELPYLLWPVQEGLVPFGQTDNGDYLFWRPRGVLKDWGVAVWDRGSGDFETFDCDLTDLLAGLATGGIRPEILPEDFYPIPNLFNSHSEPSQPEG